MVLESGSCHGRCPVLSHVFLYVSLVSNSLVEGLTNIGYNIVVTIVIIILIKCNDPSSRPGPELDSWSVRNRPN